MPYLERRETVVSVEGTAVRPISIRKVRRVALEELAESLAALERRYRMPSATFYESYQKGELGDDLDFVEWASLYELATRVGLISLP